MLPASALSPEVTATTGPQPAAAAPVINSVVAPENVATVLITLPTLDANGAPLTELNQVELFYDIASMAGQAADALRAAGKSSVITPITLAQAGQAITVTVPGLAYATEYFFDADVS